MRTGANAATQLTVSSPVQIGGINLDAGTYTLWTIPTKDDVKLIINRQSGQWGTEYSSSADIARVGMHVDTMPSIVEKFTIRIESASDAGTTGGNAPLVMEWGTFR